jgi:DNA-binding transcriptional regulator YiaG
MPVLPKDDPLAGELRRVRMRLKMTQGEFCKHFQINRATLSTWEAHGPPARGPARAFVIMQLRKLRGLHVDQKAAHGNLGIGRRGRTAGDTGNAGRA